MAFNIRGNRNHEKIAANQAHLIESRAVAARCSFWYACTISLFVLAPHAWERSAFPVLDPRSAHGHPRLPAPPDPESPMWVRPALAPEPAS
eukprot:3972315-Pleurochrysis_carterae.AAC.1